MKVAIAGYGLEGQANYRYFSEQGHDITIYDQKQPASVPDGARVVIGDDAFVDIDADLVVRTAGLAPNKITTRGKIWSATNEFFVQCPTPIIGVTGTKGKGTTASMIASILRKAGKKVHLLGNIGVPALSVLQNIRQGDSVVYEMSSFQLWDIERSPHIAAVLMIEPDHLNVHSDFDEYVTAKQNIIQFQGVDDSVVYFEKNDYAAMIAKKSKGKKVPYMSKGGIYIKDDWFCNNEEKICSTSAVQLVGSHNLENACAAVAVALEAGIDEHSIEAGLRDFKGLEHRLEYVATIDDVEYYNDSFSSAPAATIAALKAFERKPCVLIMGGIDKGASFDDLTHYVVSRSGTLDIILIGEIRYKLADTLRNAGVQNIHISNAETMNQIVQQATDLSIEDGVILLSPACASFDMFNDVYDRGNKYKQVVHGKVK